MKENLRNTLKSVNVLTDSEITSGLNYFEPRSFEKGAILIEAGKVCKWNR